LGGYRIEAQFDGKGTGFHSSHRRRLESRYKANYDVLVDKGVSRNDENQTKQLPAIKL